MMNAQHSVFPVASSVLLHTCCLLVDFRLNEIPSILSLCPLYAPDGNTF